MEKSFRQLPAAEQQILLDAIPLITILVAGADDEIDTQERAWAEKLVDIRAYSNTETLRPYYEKVEEQFKQRINHFLDALPDNTEQRTQKVSELLNKTNAILPKLNPSYGSTLYQSWRSFAKHIAKASGGILGWGSIGPEEKKVIDLPMIEALEN